MNILLMGKPGSGKGTITQNLLDEGFLQLSTGDLLRKETESGSERGKEIEALSKLGKFSSDEVIFEIVGKFLKENEGKSIIFDGFPRNVKQAEVCLNNGLVFDRVFLIDASDEAVKERIVNRRIHMPSGRVYNLTTMPPKVEGKDDETGEPLTHRTDDKLEILGGRLKNFKELTFPIVGLLKEKGFNIETINGEAPIPEQVAQVKSSLQTTTSKKLKP